jgi:hypothetical protein
MSKMEIKPINFSVKADKKYSFRKGYSLSLHNPRRDGMAVIFGIFFDPSQAMRK